MLIRYTAIIQEKLSVFQKLDDKILDFKSSYQWAGGDLHPADLPSKGKLLSEFVNNRQWINGPEWLLTIEEGSPDEEFSMPRECLTELKKIKFLPLHC